MYQTALKRKRAEAGYSTAKDFAAKIGMSYNTYIKYEKGTRNMTLEQAWVLADALKCRIDDLVDAPSDAAETEDESPESVDPREKLLSDYDSMPDEGKRTLETVADALARTYEMP